MDLVLAWSRRRGAAIVDDAAADRFEHVPWEPAAERAGVYADAAAQAGVTDAARSVRADRAVGRPGRRGTGRPDGHARTYLGLLAAALGRDELADEHFARAIDVQEREGMLVWAARAHLGWAEALAARGEPERAREHAARALELSREHGYGFIEPAPPQSSKPARPSAEGRPEAAPRRDA